MADDVDDELEQAYRYWHDVGFDEGYEVGFEDGLNARETGNQEECETGRREPPLL